MQGGEFTGVRKSDVHERQRLIQLVHLQAQEVEALKEEITLLSRKGGHILPPAQPPLRRAILPRNLALCPTPFPRPPARLLACSLARSPPPRAREAAPPVRLPRQRPRPSHRPRRTLLPSRPSTLILRPSRRPRCTRARALS